MAKKSKLDDNWEKLFEKYDILEGVNREGFFDITATQINEFREARLMTKFDHRTNLPKLFKDNKLSILPKTRGSYVIGKFDAYADLSYEDIKPKKLSLPTYIKSIETSNIYSEAVALNCAFSSGVINDILGEECLPTVSGRMSTSAFDFKIQTEIGTDFNISVNNAQCEIDGGYEGKSKLALLEAKNTASSDFLIRQIYYPYRLWQKKVCDKEVVPIFMTYSNDIYSFFIYEFEDLNKYNSLRLIEQKNYIIGTEGVTEKEILDILNNTKLLECEPEIPFPQCDTFSRIVDLLTILYESDLTKEYITENYDFDERQTGYYTNGAMYLELVEKYTNIESKEIYFRLTNLGREIMSLEHKQKVLRIVQLILKHKVFREYLIKFIKTKETDKKEIISIMKKCNLYKINADSTYERRASTVSSWCKWIVNLIE